jgi:Arc/MetJ-type ribon-helix-helix transcriptional regulator
VKKTRSITIDLELLKWLEDMVKAKEFGSVSHGIEKAITKLKEQYEKKEG